MLPKYNDERSDPIEVVAGEGGTWHSGCPTLPGVYMYRVAGSVGPAVEGPRLLVTRGEDGILSLLGQRLDRAGWLACEEWMGPLTDASVVREDAGSRRTAAPAQG